MHHLPNSSIYNLLLPSVSLQGNVHGETIQYVLSFTESSLSTKVVVHAYMGVANNINGYCNLINNYYMYFLTPVQLCIKLAMRTTTKHRAVIFHTLVTIISLHL